MLITSNSNELYKYVMPVSDECSVASRCSATIDFSFLNSVRVTSIGRSPYGDLEVPGFVSSISFLILYGFCWLYFLELKSHVYYSIYQKKFRVFCENFKFPICFKKK